MKKRGSPNLTEQPESELTYEQDGLIRGQRVLKGDAMYRVQVPGLWSRHPEEPNALCFQRRIRKAKLGKIVATLDYIGLANDPTDFVYAGDGALDQPSIVTHPDFLSTLGGKLGDEKNGAKFDEDTGDFICFPPDADHDLAGVESWLVPRVNIRRTWWTYNVPTMQDMGTILGRPVDILLPPSVKNLLYGPFTYRQVGRLFQCSQELWGSGKKGWNTLIYK
jgi:hypothetical protein